MVRLTPLAHSNLFMHAEDRFTILIVDDQPEIVGELVRFCHTHFAGAEVLQTVRSPQALRILREEKPEILIADWEMPEMTGIELLEEVKADSDIADDISVIICSGKNIGSADLHRALTAGATDYIRKPFDHPELIARISSALRDQRRLREIKAAQEALDREKKQNEALLRERIAYQKNDIEALALELKFNRELSEAVANKLGSLRKIGPEAERLAHEFRMRLHAGKRLHDLKQDMDTVHASFLAKLRDRFPQLSDTEIELATLYRIGLSSNEIAAVRGISMHGVKKSRQRLRRKLGLEQEQDLNQFLSHIE